MAVSILADPTPALVADAIAAGALTECDVCDLPLSPEQIIHFDGVHDRCVTPELLAEMDAADDEANRTAAWLRGHGYGFADAESCSRFLGGGTAPLES